MAKISLRLDNTGINDLIVKTINGAIKTSNLDNEKIKECIGHNGILTSSKDDDKQKLKFITYNKVPNLPRIANKILRYNPSSNRPKLYLLINTGIIIENLYNADRTITFPKNDIQKLYEQLTLNGSYDEESSHLMSFIRDITGVTPNKKRLQRILNERLISGYFNTSAYKTLEDILPFNPDYNDKDPILKEKILENKNILKENPVYFNEHFDEYDENINPILLAYVHLFYNITQYSDTSENVTEWYQHIKTVTGKDCPEYIAHAAHNESLIKISGKKISKLTESLTGIKPDITQEISDDAYKGSLKEETGMINSGKYDDNGKQIQFKECSFQNKWEVCKSVSKNNPKKQLTQEAYEVTWKFEDLRAMTSVYHLTGIEPKDKLYQDIVHRISEEQTTNKSVK